MQNKLRWSSYDYEICNGEKALQAALHLINTNGYTLVSVAQYEHTYTVFFRRSLHG